MVALLIILVIAIAFLISFFSTFSNAIKDNKEFPTPPPYYKGKIEVDLEKCTILNSEIPIEQYTPSYIPDQAEILNSEIYDQNTHKEKYNTVLLYEMGNKKFYSEIINKDRKTLEYYILTKRTTTIYFNDQNPDRYFFDLTFLN